MTFLPLLLLLSGAAQDPAFTQADLQRLADRVNSVAEHNEELKYPPVVTLTDHAPTDESPAGKNYKNAYATFEERDGEYQTIVKLDLTMARELSFDDGKITAVLCHEYAHLAKGHVFSVAYQGKVQTFSENIGYGNRQEAEADKVGLGYLLQLGHSRDDMLAFMRQSEATYRFYRERGWVKMMSFLTSIHPSPIQRMASIAEDPSVWKSLLSFQTGLAVMEYGEWTAAMRQFNRAIRQEDGLEEAYVNRAICALRLYYELLSDDVKASWPIPEFYGAVFLDPSRVTSRGGEGVDAADRDRYRQAAGYIATGLDKFPSNRQLFGMSVQILALHPDEVPADPFQQTLADLNNYWKEPGTVLYAIDLLVNDTAVLSYYDRAELSTELADAYRSNLFDFYRKMWDDVQQERGELAAINQKRTYLMRQAPNVAGLVRKMGDAPDWPGGVVLLSAWLRANPASGVWDRTHTQYRRLCASSAVDAVQVAPAPPRMQTTISVSFSASKVTLLDTEEELVGVLGAPAARLLVDPGRPGLRRLYWSGSDRTTALLVDDKLWAFATAKSGASVTVRLSADASANAPTITFEVGKTLEDAVEGTGGRVTLLDLRLQMVGLGLGDDQDLLIAEKLYFMNGLIVARRASDGVILSLSIGS